MPLLLGCGWDGGYHVGAVSQLQVMIAPENSCMCIASRIVPIRQSASLAVNFMIGAPRSGGPVWGSKLGPAVLCHEACTTVIQ